MAEDELETFIDEIIDTSPASFKNEKERKQVRDALLAVVREEKSPREAMGIDQTMVDWTYEQGYKLFQGGQIELAKTLFEMLMGIDPADPKYPFGIAVCLHQREKFEIAIDYFMQAALLQENDPYPYFHAAHCHLKLDEPINAWQCLLFGIMVAKESKKYDLLKERMELEAQTIKKRLKLISKEEEEQLQKGLAAIDKTLQEEET